MFYIDHDQTQTEISQQSTLFNMQIVNKKGEKDSSCKTSHAKCFRTKIFDRFHQGMSRRVFVSCVPNSPAKFRIPIYMQYKIFGCMFLSLL